MEPAFTYYNNLKFDKHKKLTISFSNEDLLKDVVFRKNRDYYISSMSCADNITKLPKYDKIKEIHNLAIVILRGGIDFAYSKKVLTLAKVSGSNATFRADKSRRSKYIEMVESFDVESKQTKEIYNYLPYKEWNEKVLRFLNSDHESLLENYMVKLTDDLKFLTRFFNNFAENLIDSYARGFDRNNVIFFTNFGVDVNSGLILFKFNFAKEYIKQFLLNNSTSPVFKNFVQKSIESEMQTLRGVTPLPNSLRKKVVSWCLFK